MNDLIKELEKQHHAAKSEEARQQRLMNEALDERLPRTAAAHDSIRYYNMGRWEALSEVLAELKARDA